MKFRFTLTGVSPLLLHADDIERSDQLTAWRKDHKNKNVSKAGDDRSPPWTWQTYVYSDGRNIVIPSDNLSASLLQAGGQMKLSGMKTYKELSQTGFFIHDREGPACDTEAVDAPVDSSTSAAVVTLTCLSIPMMTLTIQPAYRDWETDRKSVV